MEGSGLRDLFKPNVRNRENGFWFGEGTGATAGKRISAAETATAVILQREAVIVANTINSTWGVITLFTLHSSRPEHTKCAISNSNRR